MAPTTFRQSSSTAVLMQCFRPPAAAGSASHNPPIDLDEIEALPSGLLSHSPSPPTRGIIAATSELRRHFSIHAVELLYGYEHLRDLKRDTPTFEINIYDLTISRSSPPPQPLRSGLEHAQGLSYFTTSLPQIKATSAPSSSSRPPAPPVEPFWSLQCFRLLRYFQLADIKRDISIYK